LSQIEGQQLGKKSKLLEPRRQFGALPYRETGDDLEILLISSRETRRWVLPKGWPMKGIKPHRAAAQEAMEEAGLIGRIAKTPIGTFGYLKRLNNGATLQCEVTVFPMKVDRELKRWPEAHERSRQWFSLAEAVRVAGEMELRALLERFSKERNFSENASCELQS
jgi:8-oxo-dGTP pyrophosphatase MutT (NUDIX family)